MLKSVFGVADLRIFFRCNRILIMKSKYSGDENTNQMSSIHLQVGLTKEQLIRINTTCLNKQFKEMLELANLEIKGSSKQATERLK